MAKLTFWGNERGRALEASLKVFVITRLGKDERGISFIEPESAKDLAFTTLSWGEIDDLIQQLTTLKTTKKPAETLKEFVDELEEIENRLDRMSDEMSGFARSGTLHERRLNILSEIVKRLVRE